MPVTVDAPWLHEPAINPPVNRTNNASHALSSRIGQQRQGGI